MASELEARLRTSAELRAGEIRETLLAAADVIARLPVTADGVPMVPGMTVYVLSADAPDGIAVEPVYQGPNFGSGTYSTRAAAESAKGGGR